MRRKISLGALIIICLAVVGANWGVTHQVYQPQINRLDSEITSLQTQFAEIENITITRYYQWDYDGVQWEYSLPIAIKDYLAAKHKEKPSSAWEWVEMANDSDDIYIKRLVEYFEEVAHDKGFNTQEKLNFVIKFIQHLPYTDDALTTPYDDYPRSPLETLFDDGGDCEDSTILAVALLREMHYDVALLGLIDAYHMALGVSVPLEWGTYYQHPDTGVKYFYVETSGDIWDIGEVPSEYLGKTAAICLVTQD